MHLDFYKLSIILIATLAVNLLPGQSSDYAYNHPIPYEPETYVCYRTGGEITIDGKTDEPAWNLATWTKDFVDIEGALKPAPAHRTRVKMLWDDDYFYFYAHMDEPHIWATLRQRDTIIFYDDDFEIFIDPDGDSHNYYELEINALNTLWDLLLLRPYRTDRRPKVLFNWNIPNIQTAIHIEGSLNDPTDTDEFWSVEMAIPWNALIEFAAHMRLPAGGEQWRVNFSRVDWTVIAQSGVYSKEIDEKTKKPVPADNWVWSPPGYVNMHMPETWGYVQFSEITVGKATDQFIPKPDEKVKWALWNLYFQQVKYFKSHGYYTGNISVFQIPDVDIRDYHFVPKLYSTPSQFEISATSSDSDGTWIIRQDGRISYEGKAD